MYIVSNINSESNVCDILPDNIVLADILGVTKTLIDRSFQLQNDSVDTSVADPDYLGHLDLGF